MQRAQTEDGTPAFRSPSTGDARTCWSLRGARPALRDTVTGQVTSYDALAARSWSLATALAERGVRPGDRVAAVCHGRPEIFEILYACGHLHATLAPLNWRLTGPELADIARDCTPAAVFFDDANADAASQVADAGGARLRIALDNPGGGAVAYESLMRPGADPPRPDAPWPDSARPHAERAALLLYTSGTTGTAKGALLPWRQVAFNAAATAELCRLGADDSTLVFLPLFHTGGLNCLALPLLAVGGRVDIAPAFDPARALDVMEARAITAIIAVPTIYERLLEAGLGDRALPALRWLLVGGAPCPDRLLAAYDRVGHPLNQGYGLTEVGPNCFTLGIDAPRGTVGVPVPGTEARLEDDRGQVVPGAGEGELCLRGPHVTLGYWNRPAETAAALGEDGWFRTGDLARRDESGHYAIVGRKKDMYISGGENVYPAEVERVLADHPAIAQVAVIGVPDPRWGEIGLAVCVLADPDGGTPAPESLRAWARERLAGYKVPRRWEFAAALPLTSTGKVAKAALRARLGDARP